MKNAVRAFLFLVVLLALIGAAAAGVVLLNLRTYERLTYEQPVMTIEFQSLSPQRYEANVTHLQTNETQRFELAGDEWQVDARVLKWNGFANVLGLNAYYRLERISGRYANVERERTAPHSVYSLHHEPLIDFWSFLQRYGAWIPGVSGFYGSATFLPMAAGARYEVKLTQDGLIARPDNDVAKEVSRSW
jgi:hypothetical protein